MKGSIFFKLSSLLIAFFALTQVIVPQASAQTLPTFPSCTSPQGTVTANYDTGTHGIAGESASFSGSDTVYSLQNGNALQCYCGANGQGIQTDWADEGNASFSDISSFQAQGWIYVPNGADWGLSGDQYVAQNTTYSCSDGSNNGGGNGGGGNPAAPIICTDSAPTNAPIITSIVYGQNSVTLTWTKAQGPVTYYLIAYGTQPGNYQYGNPNVGGPNTTSYTIQGLSGNQTYYFVVRAGNGCQPGPFSDEVSIAPAGNPVTGPAQGFVKNVLGTQTQAPKTDNINLTNSLCSVCLWWPMLLGEILLITAFYIFTRKKHLRISRLFFGALIAFLAYIVFLLVNRGHICPLGNINFWIFTLPCRYFWVFDLAIFLLLSWIIRETKVQKKASTKKN